MRGRLEQINRQGSERENRIKHEIRQPHRIPDHEELTSGATFQQKRKRKKKLTEGLNGGDNQIASKDLAEPRGTSGLAGKSLLQLADEDVAERCRDEETVECDLYGLCVDLGTRERM